jgi:hypothetical protein
MKFKVGDKVKQVGVYYHKPIGLIGTIVWVNEDDKYPYEARFDGFEDIAYIYAEDELEIAE